jgi:chromosome segregation ATPase
MPLFTLGQAAKATGRSKAGILEAIRSGRLSAKRDERNQWQIDPAELDRVYPLTVKPEADSEREQTPLNTQVLSHFEETIGFLERLIASLESERDDLRQRLDRSEEERRATQSKLTALLTHQPNPEPEVQPASAPEDPQPPSDPPRRSWWPFRKRKR